MIDVDIRAEVYTSAKQFLYVKLILDNGVYISGIKASVSAKFPGQIWIQMPAYKVGKVYKRYIETAGDNELAQAMYKAIEDVCRPRLLGKNSPSESGNGSGTRDTVITDFDESAPIDLDDIPF